MKVSDNPERGLALKQILVVDDHPLTRHGLCHLLNGENDLNVCGEAASTSQAFTLIAQLHPDLVLSDISLPSRNGIEFIKDMKALHPNVPVLVLSMHDENIFARHALRAGARGYVMKSESAQNLLIAIRQVLQGRIYVSKELSLNLIGRLLGNDITRDDSNLSKLTNREFEVFQLIGQGLSTNEIGHHLCISPKTVETHRTHLKEKLQIKSAMSLISQAVHWEILNQLP